MTGILGLALPSFVGPLVLGVGIAGGAGLATHWADSKYYGDQINGIKLTNAQATADGYKLALERFIAASSKVSDAAARFSAQQLDLQAQFSSIRSAFASATATHTLPASCVPDADRLRILAAAISAANSAAASAPTGSRKPLPTTGNASNKHIR